MRNNRQLSRRIMLVPATIAVSALLVNNVVDSFQIASHQQLTNHATTATATATATIARTLTRSSQSQSHSQSQNHATTNTKSFQLFESSAASKWMETEKRIEEEMDMVDNTQTQPQPDDVDNDPSRDTSSDTSSQPGRWQKLHGNYILHPPSSNATPPRALLHFLGGALVGAAPDLTYRYLLERLSTQHNYLIVATPYQLSFDHLQTCDEIIHKFELVAPGLANRYGAVPVVGVGHSCGALLHMLITSLFPDTPRAANALISYNNRGVGDAVPLFEEVVVPLFSDKERNGSKLMKALIKVAREKYDGKIPSDDSLLQLLQSLPIPLPGPLDSLAMPSPLRESLTSILAEPTYNALTNAGITPILRQSLDISAQIPKLIDEVADGARDFVPTPNAMSSAARRAYRCRRTLLLQFTNDNLDDSEQLEGYLKEAESVMKMKRPMITIDLKRKVLEGNHLTPLWGPVGGEEWGSLIEESLGGLLGGGGGNGGEDIDRDDANAKAVRAKLGYEEVEKLVDELVAWLDEGSL